MLPKDNTIDYWNIDTALYQREEQNDQSILFKELSRDQA